MAGLMIRELPPALHLRLKARAASNHRSLSGEVLVILEEALSLRVEQRDITAVDRLRVRGKRKLTQGLLDRGREEGRS